MGSVSKAPASSNDISTEESGWTMYFDDFFNNHIDHNHKCSSMSLSAAVASSSSHVSDAASLVEKRMANIKQVEEFDMNKNGKRSSFKKRKDIITALIDDALEDTATSSLNSPKVLYANQKIDNPKQTEVVNLISGERQYHKTKR